MTAKIVLTMEEVCEAIEYWLKNEKGFTSDDYFEETQIEINSHTTYHKLEII